MTKPNPAPWWEMRGQGGGGAMYRPRVSPYFPQVAVANCDMGGNYITTNGGKRWEMHVLSGRHTAAAFDKHDPNVLYLGAGGIFKTVDGGVNFAQVGDIPAPESDTMFTHPVTNELYWVGGTALYKLDGQKAVAVSCGHIDVPENSVMVAPIIQACGRLTIWLGGSPNDSTAHSRITKISEVPDGTFVQETTFTYDLGYRAPAWVGNPDTVAGGLSTIDYAHNTDTGEVNFYAIRRTDYWNNKRMQTNIWKISCLDAGFEPVPLNTLPMLDHIDRDANHGQSGADYMINFSNVGAAYDPVTKKDVIALTAFMNKTGTVGHKPGVAGAADEIDNDYYGVVRSKNGGVTWDWDYRVWNWGEMPRNTNKMMAGEFDHGWIEKMWGSEWSASPWGFALSKLDPHKYAYSTHMGGMSVLGGGIWHSAYCDSRTGDDGRLYMTTTGLNITSVHGVFMNPFCPGHVIQACTDLGIMQSRDGGISWTPVLMSDLDKPLPSLQTCYWVAFDPAVPGRVWAAVVQRHDIPEFKVFPWPDDATGNSHVTKPDRNPGCIIISEDHGRTWKQTCGMADVSIFAQKKRPNSNEPWQPGDAPISTPTYVLVDPNSPADSRVLYASVWGQGVYKSVDGGRNWALANGPDWTNFDIIPTVGTLTESANSLNRHNPYLPSKMDLWAFSLALAAGGTLYVNISRSHRGSPNSGAIYKSEDGAATWQRCNMPAHGGVLSTFVPSIAADPRPNADGRHRIYAASYQGTDGVFASDDDGMTWTCLYQNPAFYVTLDPCNPDKVYMASKTNGLHISLDRGVTWKRYSGISFNNCLSVAPDICNSANAYVTTFGGGLWYGPVE